MKSLSALVGLMLLVCPLTGWAADAAPATPETMEAPSGYLPSPPIAGQVQTAGEIFGAESGYLHPYLAVGEVYTDNFFNTPGNKEEEFTTVVTPGLWLAFPGMKTRPEKLATLNTAAGGMPLTRFRQNSGHRLQGYAGYSADFYKNKNFTDQENTTQRGEGMIDVNLRGGLGLNLAAVYENTQDPYSTGASNSRLVDKYTSYLFDGIASYEVGPRLTLRANLGYYSLDYDADRNAFRDRDDFKAGAAVSYRVLPKTRVFVQYEYVDVDYDQGIQDDSVENRYFLGLHWDVTGKTQGMIKGGYEQKDFKQSGISDEDNFIAEVQLTHQFTPKSKLSLSGTRQTNESDIAGISNRLTYLGAAVYTQQLTAKTSLKIDFSYNRDEYQDLLTFGGKTDFRDDDYFRIGAGIGWSALRWMNLSLGYNYGNRDSNFDRFDYENSTFYANLMVMM
ncbi:outer membrane beta-barrel protein [Geothermobacter hydrogeniphilus]|uniref:Beta-barrel porin 2 n=1 Tax=Geothermobacter hydrogeniphilus TaxID=1969733 RepID=A0A1X0XSQ3_9BACT|nr:outer membrane beta-barrel protein [Geothermobacter hydrogeniphilus]ORJ55870.1 hypothetical protein B5V00_14815 [Geothermobacter hydrogeniphilus]